MKVNGLSLIFTLFILTARASGCNNNDGKAQENFTETYSGSFQSGSVVTDTNNDGTTNVLDLVATVHNVEYWVTAARPGVHFQVRISNRDFAIDFVVGRCVSGCECQ